MTNIQLLDDHCLEYILMCIPCRRHSNFFLCEKRLQQFYINCKCIFYKNLYACTFHDLPPIINVIKTLNNYNNNNYKNDTIHFNDIIEARIAEPYCYKLGIIHHRCCNGKGYMFDYIF